MTLTWMEWLDGRDEDHSCWCDFMDAPSFWQTRWFWIGGAAAGVCIILVFLSGIM
ncbi:hypothetical protein [Methanoregula sp.]|uniref:hypothetical protein n=1 Tax=Methanoregula sp. TaxID=2052170 RepID=UPI003C77F3EC